jgi:hypothetical protein
MNVETLARKTKKRMNIFMYDLAREQSWVGQFWERVMPALKELGYTHLGLYIEQRYHFQTIRNHRPVGGITPTQAAEALQLCRKHNLELIWFTNTLGHCDGLLANEEFRHLADEPYLSFQLCPSHLETRPLVLKMLKEFAALSPSAILHIGGDECFMNGDERCRTRGLSDADLYLEHHQWVIQQTKKLGKRPALWGDVLLRYPQLMSAIDKDVLIFDWHYHSGSAATIRRFQEHGFEVIPTTSTDSYERVFPPFGVAKNYIAPLMTEARELNCTGICQTSWGLYRGICFDNEIAEVAAAPALFENRPMGNFAEYFFGSKRADRERLSSLLERSRLLEIHPLFLTNEFRTNLLQYDSAFLHYHVFGQPDALRALKAVAQRVAKARTLVEEMRRAATRHQEFLSHLDLPLDIFDIGFGRILALAKIRTVVDSIYPYRLPAPEGTRALKAAAGRLGKHIEECDRLRNRLEELRQTHGSSLRDVRNLERQIVQLKTLHSYVSYHARTYADGVELPTHELWSL